MVKLLQMQMFRQQYCQAGGDWEPTKFTRSCFEGSWNLPDNTDINFTILVQSNSVGGYQGEDVQNQRW